MTPAVVPPAVLAAIETQPPLDEKVWNAWLLKGRLQDEAEDRKYKKLIGVGLVLLVAGYAWFFLGR
jgi:hypothetical protein